MRTMCFLCHQEINLTQSMKKIQKITFKINSYRKLSLVFVNLKYFCMAIFYSQLCHEILKTSLLALQ